MAKNFNTTGLCVPEKHYMADISAKLRSIRRMVDRGDYFSINCGRQYGKTTLLYALASRLRGEYIVLSLDFQELGHASFETENIFCLAFAEMFLEEFQLAGKTAADYRKISERLTAAVDANDDKLRLQKLFRYLTEICQASERPVVLMIDEVDSASNNQVFLDFLAQLRYYYLKREQGRTKTFQSVILAGVYDIRNLKNKIRPEDTHKINSPWNIAADFDVDMSLSKKEIAGMLAEYEADYQTGMNVGEMVGLLYDYTSGYPYLVSRLCKLIDEKVSNLSSFSTNRKAAWTKAGFLEAERMLLAERNPLFESLIGRLQIYPELYEILRDILFEGKRIAYNSLNAAIDIAGMFGFVKNNRGFVEPANRIFEIILYNYFLSEQELRALHIAGAAQRDQNQFVTDGHLNMRLVLEKFVEHFHDLYGNQRDAFIEEVGRKYFLLYLRPIINGTGNYYVESQTRDLLRTDVIVDYHGEQFVIEIKIWHGDAYHKRGEKQLFGYLDAYHQDTGYMLSFNFNKKKKIGVREIVLEGKKIIEAVV